MTPATASKVADLVATRPFWTTLSRIGETMVVVGVAGELIDHFAPQIGRVLQWVVAARRGNARRFNRWRKRVEFWSIITLIVGLVIENHAGGKLREIGDSHIALLTRELTWRRFTQEQYKALVTTLSPFAGTRVVVAISSDDNSEIATFGVQLQELLIAAQWNVGWDMYGRQPFPEHPIPGHWETCGGPSGVVIHLIGPPAEIMKPDLFENPAALAVEAGLRNAGFEVMVGSGVTSPSATQITIRVHVCRKLF